MGKGIVRGAFGKKTPLALKDILPFHVEMGENGSRKILDARDVVIAECPGGSGFDTVGMANMISYLVQKELLKGEASYVPTLLKTEGQYVEYEVAAQFKLCKHCQKPMVRGDFPFAQSRGFDGIMQRHNGGFVTPYDYGTFCTECAEKEVEMYKCYHCGVNFRDVTKIVERYGNPPAYLCNDCYETIPAKEWDKLVDEIHYIHASDWD